MEKTTSKKRVLALDVLRGITIAGMILVNNPGTWEYVFAPLRHAVWIGLTPTDMVFPFFMFIMGITTYISLRKYDFKPSGKSIKKIIVRTVVIFLVGSLIDFLSHFCYYWWNPNEAAGLGTQLLEALNFFPTARISGVLHRLAICYCIVALLALFVKHKRFPWIIAGLFIVYFVILELGNGYVFGAANVLSVVDRAVMGLPHMWNENNIDPEGVLSTIPSVGHVMIGFLVGKMIFSGKNVGTDIDSLYSKVTSLMLVGASLVIAGFLLSYACPIAKKIWTPTFSMVTCGFCSLSLGLLIYIIDIKGCKKWSRFFEAFGVNPLFMYVLADVFAILLGSIKIGDVTLQRMACNGLTSVFGNYGGSLAFAILFVLLNYVVAAYPLYKHKIYIKI